MKILNYNSTSLFLILFFFLLSCTEVQTNHTLKEPLQFSKNHVEKNFFEMNFGVQQNEIKRILIETMSIHDFSSNDYFVFISKISRVELAQIFIDNDDFFEVVINHVDSSFNFNLIDQVDFHDWRVFINDQMKKEFALWALKKIPFKLSILMNDGLLAGNYGNTIHEASLFFKERSLDSYMQVISFQKTSEVNEFLFFSYFLIMGAEFSAFKLATLDQIPEITNNRKTAEFHSLKIDLENFSFLEYTFDKK